MSLETSERVGYVHCNFCTTILATNPYYHQLQKQLSRNDDKAEYSDFGSSSFASLEPPAVVAPVKRPRVPSAYNRFIKEEIKRIKESNPEITHREAFSTAAKNWAHFPHINFGLNLD